MKINKYSNVVSSVNNIKQSKKDVDKEVSKTGSKEAVQVNISKEAQALMDADKVAFSERVDSIKQAIQNGDYQVDPDKISEGLVKALQEQKGP
ncbi:flagellar biosynthesis anti-sigma factor FlgM [Alkalibacterium sp. f15]|uniref:flagellar biosynthesis anti-sigma factor FlgM n=1 Tax=Alkalibacterium sp. f15 TaxID=3414029 RepID=UPI003BF892F3